MLGGLTLSQRSLRLSSMLFWISCYSIVTRLPRWLSDKEPASQCRRPKRNGFDSWVKKIPWKKAWQSTLQYSCLENPWTEEPGRLQSTGWLRVIYQWCDFTCTSTKVTMFPFLIPQSITHGYLSNMPARNTLNSFIVVRKEHHRVVIKGRAGLNLIQPVFLSSSLSLSHCHSMSSWTISFQSSKSVVT